MNIWFSEKWKRRYSCPMTQKIIRSGVNLRCDKKVNAEVKTACKEFLKWARKNFVFPIKVPIYVKAYKRIKTKDKDMACGTFFWPNSIYDEPYIKIAIGDYEELLRENGRDNALASILYSLIHELTHYFQWINGVKDPDVELESQAEKCAEEILNIYSETRDHP